MNRKQDLQYVDRFARPTSPCIDSIAGMWLATTSRMIGHQKKMSEAAADVLL
jgi:hypothetical protein